MIYRVEFTVTKYQTWWQKVWSFIGLNNDSWAKNYHVQTELDSIDLTKAIADGIDAGIALIEDE